MNYNGGYLSLVSQGGARGWDGTLDWCKVIQRDPGAEGRGVN